MLRRLWPIFVLVGIETALVISNLELNTWLLGWDSTQPELNFALNFVRDITGLWQYYRGLGVLDGMAHVANVMHVLYVWLLSLIVGRMYVRYAYIFFMHLLGGVGICILLRYLFRPQNQSLALLGALFYMLNPYTLQMFYQPLELFATHYASLPWIIWGIIRYVHQPKSKRLRHLALLSLAFTPQAHVPTIFIVLSVLYFALTVSFLLSKFGSFQIVARVTAIIFVTNAFWGIPYVYSALSNARDISQAKINRLSDPEIRLRNDAYGDFDSVIRMQGFGLSYEDWHKNNPVGLQMPQWRDWWDRPEVKVSLYMFTGVGLLGLTAMLLGKWHWWGVGFASMYLFTLGNLGIRMPGIGMAGKLLRRFVPYYGNIFRFTFTKFSLMYAFLLSLGLVATLWLIQRKRGATTVNVVFMLLIIWIALPAFKGGFFYWELRNQMPQEYMDAMRILNKAPYGRVLYLPQPTSWGWVSHTWGYRGSGFIWQGVRDPMLYPAFNAWSAYNEGFSNQLLDAVYTCNAPEIIETMQVTAECVQALRGILRKYDVKYVLVDRSVFVPGENNCSTDARAIELMLNQIAYKIWTRGFLTLWQVEDAETPEYTWVQGPINPRIRNNLLYRRYGDYVEYWNALIMSQSPWREMNTSVVTCPFIDMTTGQANIEYKRTNQDMGWIVIDSNEYGQDYASMFASAVAQTISESIEWPAQIRAHRKSDNLILSINVDMPGVWSGHWYRTPQIGVGSIVLEESKTRIVDVFIDKSWYDVRDVVAEENELGYQKLNLRRIHTIRTVTDIMDAGENQREIRVHTIPLQIRQKLPQVASGEKNASLEIWFPVRDISITPQKAKLGIAKNCDTRGQGGVATNISPEKDVIYMAWDGGVNCDYVLFHDYRVRGGYLLILEGENLQGRSLKVYLRNLEESCSPLLEELLPGGSFKAIYPVEILTPGDMELDFETRAFGVIQSKNIVKRIQLTPVDWQYVQNICLEIQHAGLPGLYAANSQDKELFPGFYMSKVQPKRPQIAGLEVKTVSQAFAPGWVAYGLDSNASNIVPSIHKLPHVRVNGWKNGWLLEPKQETSTVLVIYWPEIISLTLIPVSIGIPIIWGISLLKTALTERNRVTQGEPE